MSARYISAQCLGRNVAGPSFLVRGSPQLCTPHFVHRLAGMLQNVKLGEAGSGVGVLGEAVGPSFR